MEIEEMSRTSVAFSGKEKEKLEKAVIDIIIATREKITLSEIVHRCLKDHLDDTIKDIKAQRKDK